MTGAIFLCLALHVVDGDTIRCGDERIRLFGIDAPDTDCHGRRYCRQDRKAALAAKEALERLTEAHETRCERLGYDRYRRTVARCYVAGKDLGCELIRQGQAVEVKHFSRGYYGDCVSRETR